MKDKLETLFDYIKNLCESDLNRIISFVLGIVFINQPSYERPASPYCGGTRVIKFSHMKGNNALCAIIVRVHYAFNQYTDG